VRIHIEFVVDEIRNWKAEIATICGGFQRSPQRDFELYADWIASVSKKNDDPFDGETKVRNPREPSKDSRWHECGSNSLTTSLDERRDEFILGSDA
jgi:hypothetical protein|tara:strand:+ start:253 stop:540 length:288 start_codon:yes stop_codon:yes gene_type:complete